MPAFATVKLASQKEGLGGDVVNPRIEIGEEHRVSSSLDSLTTWRWTVDDQYDPE